MQHPPLPTTITHLQQQRYSVSLQPPRYSVPLQPQPQPTTITAQEEEEEEEEGHTLWIGNLQNWMDKVEEKEIRTLCIGDLQHGMDKDYIDSCFAHTGEVFTSKVIRNDKSSDETFYGFIEFKSHAIAERILHRFNGKPMPRVVVGTNFSLNWASSYSSFGSGGEQQQQRQEEEEEDDSAAAAAADDDDKLQKITVLPPQGTRTPRPTDLLVNSAWEDMLKWWSIMAEKTPTPELVYATHRVYMIGAFLKKQRSFDDPPDELIEELLDELPSHVNSIDVAKALHSIDALYPLVDNLLHQHAGIQGKVIKLIIAMVQNNPTSQQLVVEEARGRQVLLKAFLKDIDPTLETNILDAIYSVFLNDESGISAFGQIGYANLIFALKHMCMNCKRKALNLTACLVKEHKLDYIIVTELEYPSLMMQLVSSSVDAEVRKAALRCLIILAEAQKVVNSGQGLKIDDMLKEFLPGWIDVIIAMAPEVLAPFSDEIPLVEKLWNACYNEPSPLREEGLFELLGEDTLASDDVEAADRN